MGNNSGSCFQNANIIWYPSSSMTKLNIFGFWNVWRTKQQITLGSQNLILQTKCLVKKIIIRPIYDENNNMLQLYLSSYEKFLISKFVNALTKTIMHFFLKKLCKFPLFSIINFNILLNWRYLFHHFHSRSYTEKNYEHIKIIIEGNTKSQCRLRYGDTIISGARVYGYPHPCAQLYHISPVSNKRWSWCCAHIYWGKTDSITPGITPGFFDCTWDIDLETRGFLFTVEKCSMKAMRLRRDSGLC